MSVALKMRILLIGFFVIVCFLGYDLYQGYSARQNAKNNHKQDYEVAKKDLAFDLDSNKAESIFVAMPIELPQNEVVMPQAREIELPKQSIQQGMAVIKGATSALIPISSGVIK